MRLVGVVVVAMVVFAACTPRESASADPRVTLPPAPPLATSSPPLRTNLVPKGDTDGDGIPNQLDLCPTQPEDKDGFEDDDGCPDPDNDRDGIPDAIDKCPNDPETYNGYQDDDGCPDSSRVIIGP